MALPPNEIVLEDQRSVAAFLGARMNAAAALPSSNHLHDLVLAAGVGHRRAQRALSLVFDGTEDVGIKRQILKRYAQLDRLLETMEKHHEAGAKNEALAMGPALCSVIDDGFEYALAHLKEVRELPPEVPAGESTRPSPPKNLQSTSSTAWFEDDFDDESPTQRFERRDSTNRGH